MTNRDYLRSDTAAARRHLTGIDDQTIDRSRDGLNTVCVDCGAFPLAGGLRCMPCFLAVAKPPSRQRLGGNPEPKVPYVNVRRVA